jgi:hypothetical protein
MTLKLSTGLRNALLEKKVQNNYSKTHKCSSVDFVDAGSSSSGKPEIQNSSGDGVDYSTMFAVGDMITVSGSASNDTVFVVTNIPDSTRLEVQEPVTAETGQACILGVADGGSFKDLFRNGTLKIFSGSQPASADDDESGYTELCQITLASGSFSAGNGNNGINFEDAVSGTLSKKGSETWSGVNSATGTAGWFRFYDNDMVVGASTTAKRFDGAIATSGAELNMSSTSLTSGATTTIDSFDVTLPSS